MARTEGRFDLAVFLPNAVAKIGHSRLDGSLRLVGFRYSAYNPRRQHHHAREQSPLFRAARGIDGQEPELPRAVIDERRRGTGPLGIPLFGRGSPGLRLACSRRIFDCARFTSTPVAASLIVMVAIGSQP